MIFFGHAAVGSLIGGAAVQMAPDSVSKPLLAFLVLIAAIASHYAADFIPHGHYEFRKIKKSRQVKFAFSADVAAGFVLLLALLAFNNPGFWPFMIIAIGFGGALLPDVWWVFRDFFKIEKTGLIKAEYYFHHDVMHWHNGRGKTIHGGGRAWGWTDIWQIIMWVIALIFMINGDFYL
jgi:hypothetical protein